MDPLEHSKSAIRVYLRKKRNALSPFQQILASLKIHQKLVRLSAFKSSKNIALYLPNDGEISLLPLLKTAHKLGKRCFLPRVTANHGMVFCAYKSSAQTLSINRYRIREPFLSFNTAQPSELDVVFLPLVGFDFSGTRLGMGGGYYDRAFSNTRSIRAKPPILIGCAHKTQRFEPLPRNSWDIPLDAIATDTKIWAVSKDKLKK